MFHVECIKVVFYETVHNAWVGLQIFSGRHGKCLACALLDCVMVPHSERFVFFKNQRSTQTCDTVVFLRLVSSADFDETEWLIHVRSL
mmetsp:Transcript_44099/g.81067  ORF Transcript_44099/g.81067 Transcript_44099/m.81067 type:complete len:88 (+) Transcript_44099:108-371(+)